MAKLYVIVDDSKIVRMRVKAQLEFYEVEVLMAEDGLDAWNQINSSDRVPDLVISDLNMPNLSGMELLKKLKSNEKYNSIPFIFVTSIGFQEDMREEAKKLGVLGWFSKPLKDEHIGLIIEKVDSL